MKSRGVEIKVGILVTICMTLLIGFIVLLGDFRLASGDPLFIDVQSSADLKTGAPVKVAGVDAGKVASVTYWGGKLDEKTGRRVQVRVELRIDPKMRETIRKDAAFYITSKGLLGEKYVEVNPGTPTLESVSPGDILVGQPPAQLELMAGKMGAVLTRVEQLLSANQKELTSLITNASDTVKSLKGTAKQAEAMIQKTGKKIDTIVTDVAALSTEARTLIRGLNTAVGDGKAIQGTLKDFRVLARDLRTKTGPILSQVDGTIRDARKTVKQFAAMGKTAITIAKQLETTMSGVIGTIEGTSTDVSAIVSDVRAMTKKLRSGKGTIGALLTDKEMYDDIREMVKDLKRHPWKFLWKQ
jgi:phospholipid/cholesterol/gamma-HCH transport system substrate-binding protein